MKRKKVPLKDRIAISSALRDLLDQRDDFGRKKYSQHALGVMLGVSQESARRALVPDGVGPAILDAAPAVLGMSLEEIKAKYTSDRPLQQSFSMPLALALGELCRESPDRAADFSLAAFSIVAFHEPEKLTKDIAKRLILEISDEAAV
jgi:hypothetical protein